MLILAITLIVREQNPFPLEKTKAVIKPQVIPKKELEDIVYSTGSDIIDKAISKSLNKKNFSKNDLNNVHSLKLSATKFSDSDLQLLKPLSGLRNIDFKDTRITSVGIADLKKARPELVIESSIVIKSASKPLAATKKKIVYSSGNPIIDNAIRRSLNKKYFYKKDLKKVKILDLSNTRIIDTDLRYLKPLSALQTLDLSCTNITDVALQYLKPLNGLQALDLGATNITDSGLQYLKPLTALQFLELGGSNITAAILQYFTPLSASQRIRLSYNKSKFKCSLNIINKQKGLFSSIYTIFC